MFEQHIQIYSEASEASSASLCHFRRVVVKSFERFTRHSGRVINSKYRYGLLLVIGQSIDESIYT